LRARRILEILDSIYFAGCTVHLAFSRSETAWAAPLDLVVSIENQGTHPARVPFELESPEGDKRPADSRQVAHMLDVAEWLSLVGPNGKMVELRVDEIAADAQVTAVVEARLGTGPVSTVLPGDRMVVTLKDFNRGWARYPLLDAGEYTAVLEYVPPWKDEVMAAAQIGRARSNSAGLVVTEAAPATVSRSGAEASVAVKREGPTLVGRLINRSDLSIYVNLNLGPTTPFAQARWLIQAGEKTIELPVEPSAQGSLASFQADRLVEVAAGQSTEIGRISATELHEAVAKRDAAWDWSAASVRLAYVNLCDRAWQLRERAGALRNADVPKVLREPLPRRLLSLHQSSELLSADSLR
jgi:hypothetical protein